MDMLAIWGYLAASADKTRLAASTSLNDFIREPDREMV